MKHVSSLGFNIPLDPPSKGDLSSLVVRASSLLQRERGRLARDEQAGSLHHKGRIKS